MSKCLSPLAAVAAMLLCAAAAPAGEEETRLPVFQPAPPEQARASSPLLGTALEPVVRLGQELYGAGVLPRLRYVQSFAANPVGGLSQGTDTSGVAIFGADLDMAKLVGVPGGQVHATFAQFFGHELATDHIGTRTKVQSFYYPKKQFELAELTYEQSLFDKRLSFVVGRANATGSFARSTYGCRFQNVADCPFELTQAVAGFPGFPYVNWGGTVRANPTLATYLKAGAFETNSVRNTNSGFDWGLNHSTGYVLPFEAGYGTEYATDPYPRHFKLGGWYNSAPYNDTYLNTRDRSRALFAGKPLVWSGGRGGRLPARRPGCLAGAGAGSARRRRVRDNGRAVRRQGAVLVRGDGRRHLDRPVPVPPGRPDRGDGNLHSAVGQGGRLRQRPVA